jgi:iron donor protein CyaY
MDEKHYHAAADATLTRCFDALDEAYASGKLDEVELQGGILTLCSPSGRTYVLSKHAPTQQLWYASPNLGGLHFRYDAVAERWQLPDGRTLHDVLAGELAGESITVTL